MKKALIYMLLGCLMITSSCISTKNQLSGKELFGNGTWNSEKLSPHVAYYQYYSENMFGAKQRLHILKLRESVLDIAWSPDSLKKTSSFAKLGNADFAINGSFFHPEEGGPVCFLKVNGKIVQQTRRELRDDYFIEGLDSGAFVRTDAGKWALYLKPADGWNSLSSVPTVLSGGPVLIHNKQMVEPFKHSFSTNKFSRTAIGLTSSGNLILLVADGNSVSSAGLSISELARVMKSLGCSSALNLDGGGSSTMYIKTKPEAGIVNQPTDHKYYDFRGERKVASAIVGWFR